jgi:hypothetical protein
MIDRKQKHEALKDAIEIAKEHARSGYTTPQATLEYCYRKIVEIIDEIETAENEPG